MSSSNSSSLDNISARNPPVSLQYIWHLSICPVHFLHTNMVAIISKLRPSCVWIFPTSVDIANKIDEFLMFYPFENKNLKRVGNLYTSVQKKFWVVVGITTSDLTWQIWFNFMFYLFAKYADNVNCRQNCKGLLWNPVKNTANIYENNDGSSFCGHGHNRLFLYKY